MKSLVRINSHGCWKVVDIQEQQQQQQEQHQQVQQQRQRQFISDSPNTLLK